VKPSRCAGAPSIDPSRGADAKRQSLEAACSADPMLGLSPPSPAVAVEQRCINTYHPIRRSLPKSFGLPSATGTHTIARAEMPKWRPTLRTGFSWMRVIARPAAGPARSSALHDFARSGPTAVPARPSSPIPAAAQVAAPAVLTADQCRSLLADLAHIADPATAAADGTR
jgi:hypothetical protein